MNAGQMAEERQEIRVFSAVRDGAVAVYGEYGILADRQELAALLAANREAAALRLESMGGIIGHMKASMDVHRVDSFSLTEREVSYREGSMEEIVIHLSALLFAIEEEGAKEAVARMFYEIDKKIRE